MFFLLNRCCQYNKQQLVVIMVYYIHIRIAKEYLKRRITIYLASTFPNACFGWQLILKIKAICKLCFYVKSFVLVSNKIILTIYTHTNILHTSVKEVFQRISFFSREKENNKFLIENSIAFHIPCKMYIRWLHKWNGLSNAWWNITRRETNIYEMIIN